jgi:hypothetical protein
MPKNYSKDRSYIVKLNWNSLIIGMAVWVSPALFFAFTQIVTPFAVISAQEMTNGPDFSKLSLSAEQQKRISNIQLDMKPQILAVLNPSQKTQFEATLARGQTLFQGMASLNLSENQKSKLHSTMRSHMFQIVRLLTPEQREKLLSSGKPPF